VALDISALTKEHAQRLGLRGEAAIGLGEVLAAGLLVSSFCKGEERVNINIQGSGVFRQGLVDAYPNGNVRGYVLERDPEDRIIREGPWGDGLLSVLRSKPGESQPFIGTVPLVTGHLAKDLSFYWLQSEQIPSAVGLVSNLNLEGELSFVGGFLIQAMPGASDEETQVFQARVRDLVQISLMMEQDRDLTRLLSRIFGDTPFHLLGRQEIRFQCTCSWERVEKALVLTGTQELQAMLEEDGGASITCDFCHKVYQADRENLKELIARSQGV
jgi:molecular chaperone Hsp33